MNNHLQCPSMDGFVFLSCLSVFIIIIAAADAQINPADIPKLGPYKPVDNYLIDCGSTVDSSTPDGRTYVSDAKSSEFIDLKEVIQVGNDTAEVPLPLYQSARVFTKTSTYGFQIKEKGWHWIRLYFFPIEEAAHNLTSSSFDVQTDQLTLLHAFSIGKSDKTTMWKMKEYLINVRTEILSITFIPRPKSTAFINAIEVVSAPGKLISDTGLLLEEQTEFTGLTNQAYEVVHRLNVAGPILTPQNDTLARYWTADVDYLKQKDAGNAVETPTTNIKYPDDGSVTDMIAPPWVYASAVESKSKSMVTWSFDDVEEAHTYLVRLHFCDIVSKALSGLYFNVYINEIKAIHGLNFQSIVHDLAVPFYKDIVVSPGTMSSGKMTVQIGPAETETSLLNGLEIFKMNNSASSLNGLFGPQKVGTRGDTKKGVAAVGFAMMFGAFVGLGAMVAKWHKRPQDWEKRNSFSSWLLPLHAGHSTFMTSTSKNSIGSQKSGFFSSTTGFGRYFSFAELQDATKNFDQNAVIGVGGFGNVYIGELDDGTQVAVKRGNPQSEQGINEFQTEIQILSKLRHRHLVSLIGYCDENSEMILVYEYMANGPLRDHLYGQTGIKPLSWKQRLEICIGAARGLHYLHTGAAQGIIHRDVKTTNILLDHNFVSKVSDFGLSKDGPTVENTHVSTAVKGSFGYLDPEYFRRQQLTDKSDVYSFGVVLMEVLCARPALDPALPREQVNLAEWAMQWKRKDLLHKIVDPALGDKVSPDSLNKFAEAAEKCLADYGVDRPSMGDVLWNLEYALQLHEAAQGKNEEDTGGAVDAPATATSDDPPRLLSSNNDAPAQASPEHSGTDMFAHQLNGR